VISIRVRSNEGRSSRGQALVEFAMIAPFFFLLLFSIIEFGRAVYYIQILNNAAREGARYAIVHGNESTQPSGPPPGYPTTTNGDVFANNVKQQVQKYATGVIGSFGTSNFVVTVCYIEPGTNPVNGTNPPDRQCIPNNSDSYMGTGNSGRTNPPQGVNVTVKYNFQPLIAAVVPLPAFPLSGGSTLVINH